MAPSLAPYRSLTQGGYSCPYCRTVQGGPGTIRPSLAWCCLANRGDVDGIVRCGDVKRGAVLAELVQASLSALFELSAGRTGRARIGNMQLRAVPPADAHPLPAAKRCLPDLRLKRAVILGQFGGELGEGETREVRRRDFEPPPGV